MSCHPEQTFMDPQGRAAKREVAEEMLGEVSFVMEHPGPTSMGV